MVSKYKSLVAILAVTFLLSLGLFGALATQRAQPVQAAPSSVVAGGGFVVGCAVGVPVSATTTTYCGTATTGNWAYAEQADIYVKINATAANSTTVVVLWSSPEGTNWVAKGWYTGTATGDTTYWTRVSAMGTRFKFVMTPTTTGMVTPTIRVVLK